MARLRRTARPGLAAVLVLVLLWAQWAGLVHRLEHAGRMHGPTPSEAARQQADDAHQAHQDDGRSHLASSAPSESYHSCVLFDGLHLADALPAMLPSLPAFSHRGDAPKAARFASWQAPCVLPFCSRGPPRV